ncbi:unnamed protein product [Symbiodinium natans]|uniref:Uncharacterized protein n=1 Tax=Symbiodinium natans TaxID=878477 RepID=A0A812LCM2_9DINO|nr:unnamed protein product [Symbiodinium natans]
MAKPFTWDFEPRNVAFKLQLQASFHPSVGSCSVSLPFVDASGSLAAPVAVALRAGETKPRQAGPGGRSAQTVSIEKELGSFNVTLDFVKGIQQAKLPVTVALEGGQEIVSQARICLGPLLLTGSKALSPEDYHPGEPPRSKRLRPRNAVSATFTESIGVAGLYSLDVIVLMDKPLLSEEMLQRLMPACFRVEMVRGLPNEQWLPQQCEAVHVEIYPKLSSASQVLSETCPRMQSESRPHNTTADFSEPVVWLLGLASPHALREWMQHEGLVVEIHDRDPKNQKVEAAGGDGIPRMRPIHGHGVARFPLGPLLKSETLELSLRADVCPSRGNKKKRRAEALSVDSLHASGLLDEEGRQKIARREGLSKREDTTNYHSLGTVCTLRAALAVPVPLHTQIQETEEEEHRRHWETTEMQQGSVFTAKSLGDSAALTQWAPKATPSRAKVGAVAGPWRRSAEEAAEDEAKLLENEDAEAASLELTQAVPRGALGGLDCRFERYGRIFLHCSEANDGEVTRAVLTCFHELNASLLGLRPKDGEFLLRQLSEEEQEDPHLDLLSGFCVLDGRSRLFVIEGLREGHSFSKLLEVIPRGPDAPKLLHNSAIGFGERLYISFGPRLKQVKLRGTLERLSFRPALYSWNKSVSTEDAAANEVPKQLMALKGMNRLRCARENPHFPKAAQIEHMLRLYGAYISDQELEGFPAEEAITVKKRSARGVDPRRSSAAPVAAHDATRDVLAEAVITNQLAGGGTVRFQTRSTLKERLDQTNAHYEEHNELRKSASLQNFQKTNKTLVRIQSDQNVRRNDLLGKKRERETPFLEGQVYLYSSQKLNSAELQKDWLRKHMAGHESEKVWTYNPTYMSQNFEFEGAAPPGVPKPPPPRPNDTYARLEGDDREVFRALQARPREAFRKPPRDLDQSTVELLHEPFEEGEWFRVDLGEERARPIAVVETFEAGKVPHNRRYTSNPFDSQHMLLGQEHDFGPKSGFESVHYHGRRPDEDRQEQYLEHNIKEMEAAASKIRFHREMKTFSHGISRTGVTDLDRSERVLKDTPSYPMRGRVDDRFPESMRTMEPYHELGCPALEWHARLRENDDTAPLDVFTGAYIKRDPEAGAGVKRSCMSGSLTKAPWRHEGTIKSLAAASSKSVTYVSAHNFNAASKPPQSRFCEDQLWKSASRTGISRKERSETLQYKRPHHYGVHL